jgi:hypothetical protein
LKEEIEIKGVFADISVNHILLYLYIGNLKKGHFHEEDIRRNSVNGCSRLYTG